jgi:hypothetical protein
MYLGAHACEKHRGAELEFRRCRVFFFFVVCGDELLGVLYRALLCIVQLLFAERTDFFQVA